IRQSRLSIENCKHRRDVLNHLGRLFTAKKVTRSPTFYKWLSRTLSLSALLRFYTDTFALNKSSAGVWKIIIVLIPISIIFLSSRVVIIDRRNSRNEEFKNL